MIRWCKRNTVPLRPTQLSRAGKSGASRIVCVWVSQVHVYTQGGTVEIQKPTHWHQIGRSLTAPPPLLSPNSIPPLSLTALSLSQGRNLASVSKMLNLYFDITYVEGVGRDSLVDIATRYGLDGPGIESREGGARFSAPVQTGPLGPPSLLYSVYRVFPGGKAAGARCWPLTPI